MRLIVVFIAAIAATGIPTVSAQVNQGSLLHAGVRLQKSVGFYAMNGLSAEWNSPDVLKGKLTYGLNFVSSRLGSAFLNKGIACHELQLSAIRYFRPEHAFKPVLRINGGLAWAGFGSSQFSEIPQSSALLSLEPGLAYDFKRPVRVTLSLGYNLITGTGDQGYGMLWPVYIQCSGLYRFSLQKKQP